MDNLRRDELMRQVATPILTHREQLDRLQDALYELLIEKVAPLEIANALRDVTVEPFQNVGRERWYASSLNLAPELRVAGDTPDEAKINLVWRLRHHDPDER